MAQKQTIVKNVNYISLIDGKLLKNVHVLINSNGTTSILNANQLIKQKNLTQINGQGKYLMHALTDMHIHWPDTNDDDYFNLAAKAGITHFRVMKSLPKALQFKSKKNKPYFNVGFPIYSATPFTNAATLIDSIKKAGYDFIKMFSIKNNDNFVALAKAAQAAGVTICGHWLNNINVDTLLTYGYKTVEHVGYLDKLNGTALDSAIQKFKYYDIAVCPTLDWMNMAYHAFNKDSFKYRAGYKEGLAIYKTHWDTSYANAVKSFDGNESKYADIAKTSIAKKLLVLKKLQEAGVNIIAGSDAEEPYQTPGFSLIEELKLIGKAGFTNMELLQMATINTNKYFLAVGNLEAENNNFILLSKNPLAAIDHLASVVQIIYPK